MNEGPSYKGGVKAASKELYMDHIWGVYGHSPRAWIDLPYCHRCRRLIQAPGCGWAGVQIDQLLFEATLKIGRPYGQGQESSEYILNLCRYTYELCLPEEDFT